MEYKIRRVVKEDMNEVIQLCIEHAAYEQSAYSEVGKADKLAAMLFCDAPQLHCLVAEINHELVGYIAFSKECSVWNGDYYLHMDCLFLKENFRGHGIGEAMVNKMVDYAKVVNANHIEWQTPVFNTRAIKFYNRIGATSKEKIRFTLNYKTN